MRSITVLATPQEQQHQQQLQKLSANKMTQRQFRDQKKDETGKETEKRM